MVQVTTIKPAGNVAVEECDDATAWVIKDHGALAVFEETKEIAVYAEGRWLRALLL